MTPAASTKTRDQLKKDLTFAFIAFLAVAAICYGLAAATTLPPIDPSPPLAETKTAAAPNDRVVMRVNGEPITESEFGAFVAEGPEQMQFFFTSPEGRRLLANELIKLKVAGDAEVEASAIAAEIEQATGSRVAQLIGHTLVLYRRREHEQGGDRAQHHGHDHQQGRGEAEGLAVVLLLQQLGEYRDERALQRRVREQAAGVARKGSRRTGAAQGMRRSMSSAAAQARIMTCADGVRWDMAPSSCRRGRDSSAT